MLAPIGKNNVKPSGVDCRLKGGSIGKLGQLASLSIYAMKTNQASGDRLLASIVIIVSTAKMTIPNDVMFSFIRAGVT